MENIKTQEDLINNCIDMISDEEDDDNHNEHNTPLIDGGTNATNNSNQITIGKIKIFKPRRRKTNFRKCLCSFILFLVFILLIIIILRSKVSSINVLNQRYKYRSSCDRVVTEPQWNQTFPMLTIESALRLVDVNNDSVLDIIVPFGTGMHKVIVISLLFNM